MMAENRQGLCSAADRNQLLSRTNLRRVRATTQTELPIREATVQVEGCKDCNPTS